MNLRELVGHLRCNVLRDMAEPPLWTDTELVRYISQAESIFARHTHILEDDTSAFTRIATVVGQSLYELDKRIIAINELGIEEDDGLGNLTYTHLRDRTRVQLRNTYIQGRPTQYTAQVNKQSIRFYPVPDKIYTIVMSTARKPLKALSQPTDVPEIDEDYQLSLCDYGAWQALTNNDPEGSNTVAAQVFRDKWDLMLRDVKRNLSKQRAGAYPRARGNWTGKIGGRYF